MKLITLIAVVLLSGCVTGGPQAGAPAQACSPEIERLQARLAAEIAERQRVARAAARREETLRNQLEAMKSIERGILEREDRVRTETR